LCIDFLEGSDEIVLAAVCHEDIVRCGTCLNADNVSG